MKDRIISLLRLDAKDRAERQRLTGLLALFMISALVFSLGVFGEFANPLFSYDREAIQQGQVWRLLSASFVHLSTNHMLMNLSVFILATLLFQNTQVLLWYAVLILCCIAVGTGIWFFDTRVSNYVGLSGALYGLVSFGLLINLKNNSIVYILVLALIGYKVYGQQSSNFDRFYLEGFIGGAVIASSHFFGFVTGLVAGLIVTAKKIFLNEH